MGINLEHPDYIELRNRIRENPKDFVALVGSGLSIPAGIPDWLGLKFAIIDDAHKKITELPEEEQCDLRKQLEKIIDIKDLWQSFSKLKEILDRNTYEQSIKKQLTLQDKNLIPQSYDLLWKLNIKGIVDYNLDTCALDSFSKTRRFAVDHATHRDVSHFKQFIGGTQDFVFHPHGIISDSDTWVFTEEEKQALISRQDFNNFMDTLLRAKNAIILGLNQDDFAFKYVLQHAIFDGKDTGVKHYIFMANPTADAVKQLGDRNIGIIPYTPKDPKLHEEIEEYLRRILSYIPREVEVSSVFRGEIITRSQLPPDEVLQSESIHHIRDLLNGVVLSIIPDNREATEQDYKELSQFYKDYLYSLNKAWIVEPGSKTDLIFGCRVKGVVGRGAFGAVFKAEDIANGDRVAIKVLLPDVRNDQDYLRSFRRGISSMRILTKRNVPGMVKLVKAFEIPACVFMEYIEGPNLNEAIDSRIISNFIDCLGILKQVGEIVHKAHNLEEHVLHRDLKPANVILKDYYINQEIDVVVLDFDLSWHRGASELSVVHGARAQGYAAPEQTATGGKKGISTRNTAVDVFGYGMLAYYVLTGYDPRPNEQNFEEFKNKLQDNIKRRFQPEWDHISSYLAEIIECCTKDEQSERIPFSAAFETFKDCYGMIKNNCVAIYSPSLLLELATRVSIDNDEIKREEFGRAISISSLGGVKTTTLTLNDDINDNLFIAINISRVTTEYDHRRVTEHISTAKEGAVSEMGKNKKIQDICSNIGRGRLNVSGEWHPSSRIVTLEEIKQIADIIRAARSRMEF